MRKLIVLAAALLSVSAFAQDSLSLAKKHYIIDSLETSNPRVMIAIYGDNTWEYVKNDDTFVADSIYLEKWNNTEVNPYKIQLQDMPYKVTLWLVDSVSSFKCPNTVKVFSKFGIRHGRSHMGVDLPLRTGDPVYAAFDGKVRLASRMGGYGNMVILRHDNGLETTYGHLSAIDVQADQRVHAGDVIGKGGSTGHSTGPHLHFETRYKGLAFDPQWLIDFETGELRGDVFVLKSKHMLANCQYVPQSEQEEEDIYKTEEEERAEAERLAAELRAAKYHKIKSGDTLGALAIKYGTSVKAICRLNNITPKTVLKIGRTLRVK